MQPFPAYDSLIVTGQQLLYIDGRDVFKHENKRDLASSTTVQAATYDSGQPKRKKKRRPKPLPSVVDLDDEGNGQYVNFDLESALSGESPGIYFKRVDIVQYAGIYKTNPEALPYCLRNKVYLILFLS
jgi:hypothetical protein